MGKFDNVDLGGDKTMQRMVEAAQKEKDNDRESFLACLGLDTLGFVARDFRKLREVETDPEARAYYVKVLGQINEMFGEKL